MFNWTVTVDSAILASHEDYNDLSIIKSVVYIKDPHFLSEIKLFVGKLLKTDISTEDLEWYHIASYPPAVWSEWRFFF